MVMAGESDEAVFGALRAGATGLLVRDAEPEELVAAVRVVARGEALLAPGLASRLVADFMSRPERLRATPAELEKLAARFGRYDARGRVRGAALQPVAA
jgi:DNA-binding NarL/FixJ family response regulator